MYSKHKKKYIDQRLNPLVKITVKLLRQNGHESKCVCCGTETNLTIDHVRPKSKNGLNRIENCQILCEDCNQLKADREISNERLRKLALIQFEKNINKCKNMIAQYEKKKERLLNEIG